MLESSINEVLKMRHFYSCPGKLLRYWLKAFHDAGISTAEAKASVKCILDNVIGSKDRSEVCHFLFIVSASEQLSQERLL